MNFSKNPKKKIFGTNLGPFCSNLVKNEFSQKKGFKYSNYLPSCQKLEETSKPEKNACADGWTGRQIAEVLWLLIL